MKYQSNYKKRKFKSIKQAIEFTKPCIYELEYKETDDSITTNKLFTSKSKFLDFLTAANNTIDIYGITAHILP